MYDLPEVKMDLHVYIFTIKKVHMSKITNILLNNISDLNLVYFEYIYSLPDIFMYIKLYTLFSIYFTLEKGMVLID